MNTHRLAAFVCLAALVTSGVAHAADPNNTKEANERFQRGIRFFQAKDYEHARLMFAEANALVRSTDILFNLAEAEYYSGHFVDSVNHFYALVRDPKTRLGDVEVATTKYLPQAVPHVGQIDIAAPAGTAVEVDAKERAGKAPFLDPFAVEPGRHHIEGRIGADLIAEDVEVPQGKVVRVSLATAPAVATAAPDVTEMLDRGSPATPAVPPPLPPSADAPRHEETSSKRIWMTAGLGGAAVVAAAASTVLFLKAHGSSEDIDTLKARNAGACPGAPACTVLSNTIDTHNHQLTAAYIVGGGAVLFAGGAFASWFLLRHDEAPPASAIVPFITDRTAGIGAFGSF